MDDDTNIIDGNAIVYCQGAFNTPYGKTAHGLVRFTRRYRVLSVIDSLCAGQDAGTVLDEKVKHIPIWGTLSEAVTDAQSKGQSLDYMVIGLAPDGGRLSTTAREDVKKAIQLGMNIDSGLHDFLSQDGEIAHLAWQHNVVIRDIRKPPAQDKLHFFSGKIEQVSAFKIALLGTDSTVGKRTTAWLAVRAFQKAGYRAEMIGTGQTAWMQGIVYSVIIDSLVNDFVSGELEQMVWKAWQESEAEVLIIEGQGSLMNPAYPGGFEILAATRPDVIILQHAPARKEYDGFPGYPIHPLPHQIQAIEILSGKPVVAITINHEHLPHPQIPLICNTIYQLTGVPAVDVLIQGEETLLNILQPYLAKKRSGV